MEIKTLFKQLQLENSVFRGQWHLPKDAYKQNIMSKDEMEIIAVRQMITQFADKILKDHKQAIIKEEREDYNQFNIELLVINKGQFKEIIEAAISFMTDEQINKIKNG